MTGLFSLGEGRETTTTRNNHHHHLVDFQQHNHQQSSSISHTTTTNFLSLAASNEPSAPQHHHHQKPLQFQDLYSSPAGGLAMAPCRNLFNIFEEDPYDASSMMMMRSAAGFTMMNGISCGGFGGGGGGGGGGGISCQDCGNQAKKDCPHKRCRTCCRSRGFDCQTHVKSTWVPAAKRREKMVQLQQHEREQKQQEQQRYSVEHDHPKRHGSDGIVPAKGGGRTGSSSLVGTRLPTSTNPTGLEVVENFPAELEATAIFRCVRVRSMGDDENVTDGTHDQDQYAYQTAVSIGGHLFKGTVYDQGPAHTDTAHHHYHHTNDCDDQVTGAEKSTGLLNLITAAMATNTTSTAAADAGGGGSPAPAFFDPSLNYPAPLNSFMSSDAAFFPHQRS